MTSNNRGGGGHKTAYEPRGETEDLTELLVGR